MQQQTNPYPGEKDSLMWNIDQMKVSISFTDHQKLSFQAYINGIHISFCKNDLGVLMYSRYILKKGCTAMIRKAGNLGIWLNFYNIFKLIVFRLCQL